ncbi:MAG: zinc finger domain-containing protein [Acidithiobacillus sp.]
MTLRADNPVARTIDTPSGEKTAPLAKFGRERDCPICGVAAGEWCRGPGRVRIVRGYRVVWVHVERR